MDTIPNFWTFKSPIEANKDVLSFKPYFGPTQTRGFGDGSSYHVWDIGNDDSDHDNFLIIKGFWEDKYPGVAFYLWDPQLNETRVYAITSKFTEHYNHADSYSWSMRIEEQFPFAAIPGLPPEE